MSVPSISGSSSIAVQGVGRPFEQARSKVLSAVADKLNMSVDQLKSQLASGKSLADVAKATGLSQQDLMSTVTSALQQANLPAGTDLNAVANRMVNRAGGHHHHHGAAPQAPSATTSASTSPTIPSSYSSYLQGTTTEQEL
jgi:hypothetical protein